MSDCMITRRGGNTGGGGEITLQEKEVTPATSAINVTADEGYTGLSKVKVKAISPVLAANTYTPGTQNQEIQAGRWLTGRQLIKGDGNLIAANIKKGVSIFDVNGSYEGEGGSVNLQAKTVTPSTVQNVVTADSGYDGLSSVTVSGDSNLIASNIKSGVPIFGVTGSFSGGGLDHNSAILKVITATGNSVLVTGSNYSVSHQQSDGFLRGGDNDVTDHFFTIPAASFGTFQIKVTSAYGEQNYSVSILTSGNIYERICGGKNVILDSTYGLQSGVTWDSELYSYSENDKYIYRSRSGEAGIVKISPYIHIACYENMYVSFQTVSGEYGYMELRTVEGGNTLCSFDDSSGASYSDQAYINKTRVSNRSQIVFDTNVRYIFEITFW